MFQIACYIIKNNPWYKIPSRFLYAFLYQCYKRTIKGIFTQKLFNGKKIFLFPQNPISSAFVYSAIPDKKEIEFLRKHSDNNTIFLDIGANIGAYSILLMDKVKKVYAFEAHPRTAQFCKMNFLLNEVEDLQVITAAVGQNSAPKYFTNLSAGDPVNKQIEQSQNAIMVPGITLDAFIKQQQFDENCNFVLKMDVEGFEHDVFAGAKEFFQRCAVRAIIFETFSEHMQHILDFLHSHGFHTELIGKHNMLAVPYDKKV